MPTPSRRVPVGLRLAAITLLVLACSVSLAHAGPAEHEARPEVYRIEGRPSADGCGGEIVLAARHVSFGATTMSADVVNRTYALTRTGDRLLGEGRFVNDFACAGTRLFERWDLRRVSDGVLQGTLRSTWRLRPRCEPCTIEFAIRATRLGG